MSGMGSFASLGHLEGNGHRRGGGRASVIARGSLVIGADIVEASLTVHGGSAERNTARGEPGIVNRPIAMRMELADDVADPAAASLERHAIIEAQL
jgi:hypothetical protein